MEKQAVKAILFDLDNTLIETSRAGAFAIQKVTVHTCVSANSDRYLKLTPTMIQVRLRHPYNPKRKRNVNVPF